MLKAVLAISLISATSTISAQQMSVEFDPAKTQIHWSLAGNVHTTHGTFRFRQGHVFVNPATGVMGGDLVADATSGDSGNGARDKRIAGARGGGWPFGADFPTGRFPANQPPGEKAGYV